MATLLQRERNSKRVATQDEILCPNLPHKFGVPLQRGDELSRARLLDARDDEVGRPRLGAAVAAVEGGQLGGDEGGDAGVGGVGGEGGGH